MSSGYEPSCNFLVWVLNDEAPLTGSKQADANLRRVIELTSDDDPANRDWAAFILGTRDHDTPAIREALLASAEDPNERVRAEAIRGLARKDRMLALPLVRRALSAQPVMVNVFEAAAIVADPSLVEALRGFAKATGDQSFDQLVTDALHACETGEPAAQYL